MATGKKPVKKASKAKDLKPRKASARSVKGGVVLKPGELLKKLPNLN